jgi:uncharacterized protein YggE
MFATLSLGLLITGALAWSGRGAVAQGPDTKDRQRTIHTAGTGTVRIRPDRARVFIGVQTYAATVKQARSQNAAQTKQVTDALTALKIPDLKMKSTNMTVELIPADVEGSRTPKVAGYRVTNTFTALIANDDPERLGPLAGRVLDTALESGANLVQQIVFFKEDTAPAKRQALIKAVEDAQANAAALATGARENVKGVITIDGQPQFAYEGQQMLNSVQSAMPEGVATSLMAGEQEVTCNVTATYSF